MRDQPETATKKTPPFPEQIPLRSTVYSGFGRIVIHWILGFSPSSELFEDCYTPSFPEFPEGESCLGTILVGCCSCRRFVSQCVLKSRTVTWNRGYTPYSDEFEAESTDKSHLNEASRCEPRASRMEELTGGSIGTPSSIISGAIAGSV